MLESLVPYISEIITSIAFLVGAIGWNNIRRVAAKKINIECQLMLQSLNQNDIGSVATPKTYSATDSAYHRRALRNINIGFVSGLFALVVMAVLLFGPFRNDVATVADVAAVGMALILFIQGFYLMVIR